MLPYTYTSMLEMALSVLPTTASDYCLLQERRERYTLSQLEMAL